MSRFIKLTSILLNTNDIHKIVIQPNKYVINVVSKKLDGFHWIIGVIGLGNVSSYAADIEVCKTKHPVDYNIVSSWIEKHGE